jgi:CBS domain-containing protein
MPISDLMTQAVESIDPEATLQEAAQRMRAASIGALPVREGTHLVGILTERDLVARAVAEGRDPKTARVREVMTPDLITCYADQDITEASRLMRERQIRHLVVVSRDQRPVGIMSLRDVPRRERVDALTEGSMLVGTAIRWPI